MTSELHNVTQHALPQTVCNIFTPSHNIHGVRKPHEIHSCRVWIHVADNYKHFRHGPNSSADHALNVYGIVGATPILVFYRKLECNLKQPDRLIFILVKSGVAPQVARDMRDVVL